MQNEEKAAKKKILDSLEHHTKQAHKLAKELGLRSGSIFLAMRRVETKTVFSIFAKSENDAKMSKFSCPRKFSRKWVRFCDKHLQNDKFKRKFDHFTACPLLLSDLF
jgi:L-rhamnose mutarotase